MTFPKMVSSGDEAMSLKGAYNIHLGQVLIDEGLVATLVANDFDINRGDVVLMTGANRGGKTTFTQMIGQVQVLGQLGFPIPAKDARLAICDTIATHFPMIEQAAVDYGRFGRACFEFKEAYTTMSEKSLLLMNESFSGTSHLESIEIASEVVKALAHKGVATIYNTHLHALFETVEDLGHVRSFRVGDIGSEEGYQVREGPPKGSSQAMDIAKTYGVTFDRLVAQLGGDGHDA